jgi:S1-C subfamily serine protease
MGVRRRSAAGRFGFQPGDRARTVNGEAVKSVKRLQRLLGRRVDRWRITIERGGKALNLEVE